MISWDVVFNEDASWNFVSENEMSEIPLPFCDDHVGKDSLVITSPLSSPSKSDTASPTASITPGRSSGICNVRSGSASSLSTETPPRKFKSLTEIYESCEFALYVSEPTCFEEAIETEVWKSSMMEEMRAIEHNHP